MKKILLIVGGVLLIALVVGGVLAYFIMKAPYQPGMVRAADELRDPLTPPPAQTTTGSYWQVTKDVRLYHQDLGSGEDVLVLHGGPGIPPARTWKGLDRLAGSYRFRYYHQRGCGRSSRPIKQLASDNFYENIKTMVSTLGLQAQVADIERIRQILGNKRLILVGHSFGGFLAALYAAEFPRQVKALVLVAPANVVKFPMESGGNLLELIRRRLPPDRQAEYDKYLEEYMDFRGLMSRTDAEVAAFNSRLGKYFALAVKKDGRILDDASLGLMSQVGGLMVQAMYLSMGMRHDYRPALKGLGVPVLVIHGDRDMIPAATGRTFAGHFDDARFEVIAGAGHFVFDDRPEEFARVVKEFLGSVK